MLRILLSVALLLFFPFIAHSKSIEKFAVGDWNGGSYAGSDGRFSHCSITGTYRSGTTLGIRINKNYELYIGLIKKQWELEIGSNYTVTFYVDDRSLGSYSTNAISKNHLWFNIGKNKAVFDSLRKGRTLKIKAAKKDFILKLTNSGNALSKLKKCVDQKTRKASVIKDPFASTSVKNPFSQNKRTPPDTSGRFVLSEIKKFAIQAEEFTKAYEYILTAITQVVAIDEISGALISKDIQPNFAETKLKELTFTFKSSMAGFERNFKKIEKRDYKSKNYSLLQNDYFNGLNRINFQIRESMDGGVKFLQKSIRGDAISESTFYVRRLSSYKNLLEAENLMMGGSLAGSKKNHPQHYATKLMILDNNALAQIYDGLIKVFSSGEVNQLVSKPRLRNIITDIYQAIEKGRHFSSITNKLITKANTNDPKNPRWAILKKAMATYEETFSIETAIAKLFERFNSADLMEEMAWDELALFEPLVHERTAIQIRRTRLMQDF